VLTPFNNRKKAEQAEAREAMKEARAQGQLSGSDPRAGAGV
jgi:hypothetical protein